MQELILHRATKHALAKLKLDHSVPLLFFGPRHLGKYTVAERLGQKRSARPEATIRLEPVNGTIAAETVRQLRQSLRLRLGKDEQQTIIIDHAETMSPEAQNTLLKVLEEPPDGTLFILCTEQRQRLLPTIRSRCFAVAFHPQTDEAHSVARPGLAALLQSDPELLVRHQQHQEAARLLVKSDRYQRLCQAIKISHDEAFDVELLSEYLLEELRSQHQYRKIPAILDFLRDIKNHGSIKIGLFKLASDL